MNANILEVKELVKVYKSPKGGQDCKALHGVNLEIEAGEFVAIMGGIWLGEVNSSEHAGGT